MSGQANALEAAAGANSVNTRKVSINAEIDEVGAITRAGLNNIDSRDYGFDFAVNSYSAVTSL